MQVHGLGQAGLGQQGKVSATCCLSTNLPSAQQGPGCRMGFLCHVHMGDGAGREPPPHCLAHVGPLPSHCFLQSYEVCWALS